MITWATSDGREEGGDRVVPAASTIKLFVASAFWRSELDPNERVEVPPVPWSVADSLSSVTLGDCALLSVAFSDNAATNAGQRGAILYTIIESCRRHAIDPYAYLRDVLTRLPTMTTGQIKDVTPAAWAKARRAPLKRAA